MTQRQKEEKIYEMNAYIADQFRQIQGQGNALKNPEDRGKNAITMLKIKDFIDSVNRAYDTIDRIELEEVEEEDNNDDCVKKYLG